MATALSTLVPRVNLKAKMVPEPVALFALRDAAAEFCRQSGIVTEILPDITVVAGTASYAMTSADAAQRGVKALDVWLDGKELDPKTPTQLKEELGNWAAKTGTPQYYTHLTEGTIVLVPKPEAAGVLSIRASTAPTLTADAVDDALADRWWKAIVAGALSALMDMQDEPFYDQNGAATQSLAFGAYIDEAKALAYKGYTRARSRTVPHNF